MNESKCTEVFNRKLFLIGQNTIREYEREQGKLEIALKMIKNNRPIQYIIEDTGLPEEAITELKGKLL